MGFNECSEALGDTVDSSITSFFRKIGTKAASRPKTTIILSLLFAGACASGISQLETENRGEKLWVPQNTDAHLEMTRYKDAFKPKPRISTIIITSDDDDQNNILTKDALVNAMKLHQKIEDGESTFEGETNTLTDWCTPGASACTNSTYGSDVCGCQVSSILKVWNYNITTLQNDRNFLTTLNSYGQSQNDLLTQLGYPKLENGNVVSAEAFSLTYFLQSNGQDDDPPKAAWEEDAFLSAVESSDVSTDYPGLSLDYYATRSFNDEFNSELTGDIKFVQVSYLVAFIFLGATLGRFCGHGSRWAVSLCALVLVAVSTGAGIGLASYFGLFYGPVHSLLPFVLLGIGVDDVFIIVNAFNRERTVPREDEDNEAFIKRSANSLARSGASITVTSLTDLVAFAISSSSALPALASFCAYAAIGVGLLWLFAATFFFAVVVQDEKRQRDNKRDVICCFRNGNDAPQGKIYEDNALSSYFRKYHCPVILKTVWHKIAILCVFAGLFAFGVYGSLNLAVEDSARNFIPDGSYINDYLSAGDKYFTSGSTGITGIEVAVVFEDGQEIFDKLSALATLDEKISGKSDEPPYIAEPDSEATYSNVIAGLADYLATNEETVNSFGISLGDDGWPTEYADFITLLRYYVAPMPGNIGGRYINEVDFKDESDDSDITIQVTLQYIKLTKESRGKTIDDADKQIEAMDTTRDMIAEWKEEGSLPPAFVFSDTFISIEGFKIIKLELFRNAGLAIIAVGVITFLSLGNVITAFLITISVFFCVVEILGFMYACGLVIDSISVINIVLAVGLSVDYSAHVGHCFMVKSGSRDERVTEALADIGASVLNGAISTFLAVAVLLFSSTYVFKTLSIQFALTVGIGVINGLIFLPVMLSLLGPKPFSSSEKNK